MKWQVEIGGKKSVVELPDTLLTSDIPCRAIVNGKNYEFSWQKRTQTLIVATEEGHKHLSLRTLLKESFAGESESRLSLEYFDSNHGVSKTLLSKIEAYAPGNENRGQQVKSAGRIVRAPMTGKVLSVAVEKGTAVESNAILCVIEAMKMENKVFSQGAGTIEKLNIRIGQSVTVGQEMIVIK